MTTINYNGMELECIESGYWPDGVTLVCLLSDGSFDEVHGVICLKNKGLLYIHGGTGVLLRQVAILPQKPAPRRLTNRELGALVKRGYDILMTCGSVYLNPSVNYDINLEGTEVGSHIDKLRAPNSDEWLEPTSDLLEV